LFQEVVYRRLPPSTRRRLHQTIGEGLESAYAGRTSDVASDGRRFLERRGPPWGRRRGHPAPSFHALGVVAPPPRPPARAPAAPQRVSNRQSPAARAACRAASSVAPSGRRHSSGNRPSPTAPAG